LTEHKDTRILNKAKPMFGEWRPAGGEWRLRGFSGAGWLAPAYR